MFSVIDCGHILTLVDGVGNPCAKFAKAGSSMQPMGGVYWYKPLEVSRNEADQHFQRHLASAPSQTATTLGERIRT